MHIPDGFLDAKTWITLDAVAASCLGVATSRLSRGLDEKKAPLLGVTAAFIFAAQMLNFPVAGGTSGHFMGAALAAILLGPVAGLVVMSTVLIVQCLLFQDGGLLVLGANIFNMGVIGCFLGYGVFKLSERLLGKQRLAVNTFIASWFSIVAAASAAAVELAVSGTVSFSIALPAMAGVHALIGIGEGLITASVLRWLLKTRPELLARPAMKEVSL